VQIIRTTGINEIVIVFYGKGTDLKKKFSERKLSLIWFYKRKFIWIYIFKRNLFIRLRKWIKFSYHLLSSILESHNSQKHNFEKNYSKLWIRIYKNTKSKMESVKQWYHGIGMRYSFACIKVKTLPSVSVKNTIYKLLLYGFRNEIKS
jgi:hypothetical protein